MIRMVLLTFLLTAGFCSFLQAQPAPDGDELTLDQIMADPDWIGRSPENPRWSGDGKFIYYQRRQNGTEVRDWYRADTATGKSARVTAKELPTAIPVDGEYDSELRSVVFTRDGDLFVRNLMDGTNRQLTRTSAVESNPAFLVGGQRIQFRRDGAMLIRHLKTGLESEPIVLRFEDPPADPKPSKDFLAERELDLFEFLKRQDQLRDTAREAEKELDEANLLNVNSPVYLGKGLSARSQTLSPNARWLAVVVAAKDSPGTSRRDRMPVWVRDDGYVENREVRALVGQEPEPAQQLKLVDVRTQKVTDLDLSALPDIEADRLSGLVAARPAVATGTDSAPATNTADSKTPEKPAQKTRAVSIESVSFSDDSRWMVFQCFSTDNKDRWIVAVNLSRIGKKDAIKVLHHRFDEAWIGPHDGRLGWIPGSSRVWFISEQSGYAHLSLADAATGDVRSLTDGTFEVSSPQVSRDRTRIWFTSNEIHPGRYELYSVDLATGERKCQSSLGGVNAFALSQDETSAVALHSEATKPPELVLIRLDGSQPPKTLTRTTTKQFRSMQWTPPRHVEIPSRHGGTIHSRIYLPEDVPVSDARTTDPGRSVADSPSTLRPAVMFVHGAGYLQNAHQGWSGYFREFMFHTLLTRRGYVVLDMDYRASAGYGRDWRTAIYRRMGTPELEDLADGVRVLADQYQVDPKRIGVYGGSYGGFLTLMALFREPDLFACGAALRPVTDWAHYNHGYTSNILNTPETDPEAYRVSSPINFAEGLRSPLLICHGMVDDNVFFKDTVRLTQRLIELKKNNWSVAMYPVEPHAFRQPTSWRDEYQRILDLFERELRDSGQ